MITSGSSRSRRQRVPRSRMKSRRSGTGASWAGRSSATPTENGSSSPTRTGSASVSNFARGETWMLQARGRWLDFALACRADIVGDWHCHPGGSTTVPSDRDVKSWQATREVLGSRAYVGLIFVPRKVLVQGIHVPTANPPGLAPSAPGREYLVTQAGYQPRANFMLRGEEPPPEALRLPEEVRRLSHTGGAP